MDFTTSAACATLALQRDKAVVFNKPHFMWLNKALRLMRTSLISVDSLNPLTPFLPIGEQRHGCEVIK